MVGPGEVDDDLQPETAEECAKYGEVVKVLVYEVSISGLWVICHFVTTWLFKRQVVTLLPTWLVKVKLRISTGYAYHFE